MALRRSPLPRVSIAALALAAALALPAALPTAGAFAADGSTVTGHVTDSAGKAAANMVVGWLDPTTGDWNDVHTDASGAYSLPVPASATHVILYTNLTEPVGTLVQSNGGETSDSTQPFRTNVDYAWGFYGAGGTRSTAFQTLHAYTSLPATADLLVPRPGTAVFAGALPTESTVYLESVDGTRVADATQLPPAGSGSIANLVPGTYRAHYYFGQSAYRQVFSAPFTVPEGGPVTVPAPTEFPGLPAVAGVVTAHGAPVAGVEVHLRLEYGYSYTDRTDARGRYRFPSVETDYRYSLTVPSTARWVGTGTHVTLGASSPATTTRNLTVTRAGSIRGTTPTKGLAADHLVLRDAKDRVLAASAYDVNVLAKTFTITGVRPGRWTVFVENTARSRYASKVVRVKAGKAASTGRLAPHARTLTLSGTVGVRQQPELRHAAFSPLDPSMKFVESFSTNIYPSETRYLFKRLLPGTYTASVDTSTTVPSLRSIRIVKNTARHLTPGAPLPRFAGRAVVTTPDGDVPTDALLLFTSSLRPYRGYYYPDEGYGPLDVAIANYPSGTLSGETQGVDVTLDGSAGPANAYLQPYGSPVVLQLPKSVTTHVYQAKGGVLDLGTVRYTVSSEGTGF